MAQKNRWHPVMLPEDYRGKLKQSLSEVEAQVESQTRYEPDPDAPPPLRRRLLRFDVLALTSYIL